MFQILIPLRMRMNFDKGNYVILKFRYCWDREKSYIFNFYYYIIMCWKSNFSPWPKFFNVQELEFLC
ncbi:unnamed protein product [Blepharisma stoltei]|uniref:Uncharacterized protein n=1 Tax=Blepharisma stoltei TaxID=1481888 RepID=A0AAU9IG97_9CILI|nr:unnamed protein product [Blepharisma stoltei]